MPRASICNAAYCSATLKVASSRARGRPSNGTSQDTRSAWRRQVPDLLYMSERRQLIEESQERSRFAVPQTYQIITYYYKLLPIITNYYLLLLLK